jgi:hypothetical protein
VYFSEEIYNAMNHGYKFKIIRGYTFDKGYIFKDYVEFFYELKKISLRGSPDYIISKLLLNSLYGRLGMNPEMEKHVIVSSKDAIMYHENFEVCNIIDLHNDKELISYIDTAAEELDIESSLNISVPISSAVTSYARVYMSIFKTIDGLTLYYSDTDSIDIDKPLDEKYIGNELGMMKLEHTFNKAIFLAPKVYGGKTNDYEYVRVKGLKNPVHFEELFPLLFKDNKLEMHQEK